LTQSVYHIALWRGKTQIFATFRILAFCAVASWRRSEEVEHTQLQTFPYVKIVSVLQCLHGEIGAQTLTFKSVTDKQTAKKNSTVGG